MIAALAFLPPQDVVNSFDELCVVIRNQYDGDADKVFDYLEDTYVAFFVFPIELWKMFNRTNEELLRPKNNIEPRHNSFQANVSSRDILSRCFIESRTLCLGKNASKPSRTCTGTTKEQIRRLQYAYFKDCRHYPNREIMGYLRHIAHHCSSKNIVKNQSLTDVLEKVYS